MRHAKRQRTNPAPKQRSLQYSACSLQLQQGGNRKSGFPAAVAKALRCAIQGLWLKPCACALELELELQAYPLKQGLLLLLLLLLLLWGGRP
jgi:hypothetical protein